jgi:hypothetical protein
LQIPVPLISDTWRMLKPVAITPAEIRNVVTREDDFGHEMRVGNVIRSSVDAQVRHAGTYTDPVTQKPRQFDYRCAITKGCARLCLAIECKNLSLSNPMVMCGTMRHESEAFHDLVEARNGHFQRRGGSIIGFSSITRRATRQDSFYDTDKFVGKSIVRIQTDRTPMARTQDADIYDKWSQAISSAIGLAEAACNFPSDGTPPKFLVSILPVVVVPDRVMWVASYDQKGDVEDDPKEIDACELYVAKEIELGEKGTPLFHRFSFSHVHFFTVSGFGAFLSKVVGDEDVWSRLLTDKAREL